MVGGNLIQAVNETLENAPEEFQIQPEGELDLLIVNFVLTWAFVWQLSRRITAE